MLVVVLVNWVLMGWFWVLYLTPFLILTPFTCRHLFYLEAARKLGMEGKRQGNFYTQNFILRFNDYSVVRTFSWTSRSHLISQKRCLDILESFLVSCRLGVCPVGVSSEVYLAEMALSRRLPLDLGSMWPYLASSWGERVLSIAMVTT